MKKKFCTTILSMSILCSLLSGCSDKHAEIIMDNAKGLNLSGRNNGLRSGRCRTDVLRTSCPRQGARVLLIGGTAVESAFALLLTKVTKEGLVPDTSRTTNVREGSEILYLAKISYNRHNWRKYKLCAISGTSFRKRGEEHNDEKND